MRSASSSLFSFCAFDSLFFSALQRAVKAADFSSSSTSSFSSDFRRLFEPAVAFLLQGFLLDLEPDDFAIQRIQLLRLGIDLHLQPRRRLVHQVDGLVGQEAVGDVAVRQRRRRHQRGIGDAHAVMLLVFVLQAAQDRDRILDRGLADIDRLEAPRQRGVLLDMLLVFVERGRADAVQFAARQRRLQEVGRVHRAVRLAGADQRVHLVDEQDDAAFGGGHLLQHGLQPLLEFAAIFRAGDQRAEIEREQLLVLQALRHVAVDDAQRKPLDDRGLADAGFADQHGIVLGAPGQHLDGAPDLLVAADHRIELAVARRLGQVAGIFLQRVIGVLGGRGVRGAALAQGFDRRIEILRRDAALAQDAAGLAVLVQREPQQQPFDGDEAVAGLVGGLFGGVEGARQIGRQIDLSRAAALTLSAACREPPRSPSGSRANCRRRGRSGRRPSLRCHPAAPSAYAAARTAGGHRASQAIAPTG